MHTLLSRVVLTLWLVCPGLLGAQEDTIHKRLMQKAIDFPPILHVAPSPYKGLFEVVTKNYDIYYTDAEANFLIDGNLIDTRTLINQTEASLDKLLAISFDKLPVNDAVTIVRGNGLRKLAVFADPNCGYCKHFEAELQKLNNITIYLYLVPLLGRDSAEKSKNIWCSGDKQKAWQDWMLKSKTPLPARCDTTALARNLELAKKSRLTGTPTVVFANGSRVAGAIEVDRLEQLLKVRS